MFKKLAALAAALAALCVFALALEPSVLTTTMYEKAANTAALMLPQDSDMSAVYIIIGVLIAFVLLFWLMDRKNRRALKAVEQELKDRGKQI